MNIFFLSIIPQLCAQMHGDRHLIKMILETAQLLSTAYRWLHGQRPNLKTKKLREALEPVIYYDDTWIDRCEQECRIKPYKMTHYNHGCSIWVRQCPANFIWLCHLGLELCKEKLVRLPDNPGHKSQPLIEWFINNVPEPELFVSNDCKHFTSPYLAMPVEFKIDGDCIASYKKYYQQRQADGIVYYKWLPERKPDWL